MGKETAAKYFDERFNIPDISTDLLPFFHSCDAFFFRKILTEKKLKPSECTIFKNEELLYLFYGKPAYRSSNNASSGLHSLLPISFILRTDSIDKIKRIAPFDTGAFNLGLFKEYLHPGMELKNFFLTPRKESIAKTVDYFFANNEHYYLGRPKQDIKFDALDFEVESYYNLIKGVGQSKVDDRKASIEIQSESEIELTKDSVEAIIMPDNFITSEFIQDIVFDQLQAEVITYESYGIPSDNYYSEILSLTKEYLIKKDYLHART